MDVFGIRERFDNFSTRKKKIWGNGRKPFIFYGPSTRLYFLNVCPCHKDKVPGVS